MSKREKALIIIMLMGGIIGVGYTYLISPAIIKGEELQLKLEETQVLYDAAVSEMQMLPMIAQNCENLETQLEELYPTIEPYMENEALDRTFTDIANSLGVTISSMGISHETDSYVAKKDEIPSQMVFKIINIKADSTYNEILTFIDRIQGMKETVITGVSLSGVDSWITTEIIFNFYMYANENIVEES